MEKCPLAQAEVAAQEALSSQREMSSVAKVVASGNVTLVPVALVAARDQCDCLAKEALASQVSDWEAPRLEEEGHIETVEKTWLESS